MVIVTITAGNSLCAKKAPKNYYRGSITIICCFMDYELQEKLNIYNEFSIRAICSWGADKLPPSAVFFTNYYTCIFNGKIISLNSTSKDLGFIAGGIYYLQFIIL